MADGKPPNRFAFNARPRNKSFTMNVLSETHLQWKTLMRSSNEVDLPLTSSNGVDLPLTSSNGVDLPQTSSNGHTPNFAAQCTQIESK